MSFSAPDGSTFDSPTSYKRYLYDNYLSLRGLTGEVVVKPPESIIPKQQFDLADLRQCTVVLQGSTSAVQADNLEDCRVFVAPCRGSAFLRNCRGCHFTVACGQLRMRDCEDCTVSLYAANDPVIENSRGLTFGPFNGAFPGLDIAFEEAGFDPADNHWEQVFDFGGDVARTVAAPWSRLDTTQWAAPDGALSPAAALTLLNVFDKFDADGDGVWNLGELNTYQAATGEDTFPTQDSVVACLTQLGLELGPGGCLSWPTFLRLCAMQGVDTLLRDLATMGYSTANATTAWVMGGGAGAGPAVNPVPEDAGVIVPSDGGHAFPPPAATGTPAPPAALPPPAPPAGDLPPPAPAAGGGLALHPVLATILGHADATGADTTHWFTHFDASGSHYLPRGRFDTAVIGLVYGLGVARGIDPDLDLAAAVTPAALDALVAQLPTTPGGAVDYRPLVGVGPAAAPPAPQPHHPPPPHNPPPPTPLPDAATLISGFENALEDAFRRKPALYTKLRRWATERGRPAALATMDVTRQLRGLGVDAKPSIVTLLLLRAGGQPSARSVVTTTPTHPAVFTALSQGKSVVKAAAPGAGPPSASTVPAACITQARFCEYLARLRRGGRVGGGGGGGSPTPTPPTPRTPGAAARRLRLWKAALGGDVPPKHAADWLSRADVEAAAAVHRALSPAAMVAEAKRAAAEWGDSRVGRAAMWARVAKLQRAAGAAPGSTASAATLRQARADARKQRHGELLRELQASPAKDVALFWQYVAAARESGGGGGAHSFPDWLSARQAAWWANRAKLRAYLSTKRRAAVAHRREESQVAVAVEVVQKVADLVARAPGPGLDLSSALGKLRRLTHGGGVISRRAFETELRGVLTPLTTLPETAAEARRLLDARSAAEAEVDTRLRTPAGAAELAEAVEAAAYADDAPEGEEEEEVEARARAGLVEEAYAAIVRETFADDGKGVVEAAGALEAERAATAAANFQDWLAEKRAAEKARKAAAAEQAAKEKAAKAGRRRAGRAAFRKWLKADRKGCYITTGSGRPRRVRRPPKAGPPRGRPRWVDVEVPVDGGASAPSVDLATEV